MDVVVKVQDRDALLVWTIPDVTSHNPSIDIVVDELADPKEFAETPFPKAFTLNDSGSINYLPPSQWVDISSRLERLGETEDSYSQEQWRVDSIEIIRGREPIYVWLDEFQNWFDWHIKQEREIQKDTKLSLCLSPHLTPMHAEHFKQLHSNYQSDDYNSTLPNNLKAEQHALTDGMEQDNSTPANQAIGEDSKFRELKQGLREIWEKEGRPEARSFFPSILKKYVNKPGSPVTSVFTSGKEAGISFRLSSGTTGNRTKKTISNYVSEFKKTL